MEKATTSNDVRSSISIGSEMVSISIPQEASVEVKFEPGTKQASKRCIQKVPEILRQEEQNKRDYDPAVVSFGPYHHGKAELKLAEDFKPKALELFVAGSGKDTNFFYSKVLEVIHDLRRCYEENSTDEYDDVVFARMMLLDACFIINYICMAAHYQDLLSKSTIDHHEKFEAILNQHEFSKATSDHLGPLVRNLIFRDLFLLENQIPLMCLRLLIYSKYGKDEGEELLDNFLSIIISGERKEIRESNEDDEEPLHLLEGFRRLLVADCSDDDDETNHWSILEWLSLQSSKFRWLWKREKINRIHNLKDYHYSFRSITDLKTKGINFTPSLAVSLKVIKFKSSYFYGELQLPFSFGSIYTKVLFLNLVAFEMCPNNYTDQTVSTYINFMKSLIDSPKDVKELREKQIISNTLGSDEEVVQVFKDIKTFEVNNYGTFYKVKEKINEHYNSKAKTWMAELIHTHFNSPWTAVTLLAAILLICLTFLQTYFTIHPTSK